MKKITETTVVEEFDENGNVIKKMTTNKEYTQEDNFETKLNRSTVAVNGAGEKVIIPSCFDELPGQLTFWNE